MPAPCDGLCVLDLARGYGAIIGMVLADNGADVVKVEPPGGEAFRSMPAFLQWNRGKRGVALDLTTGDGRARLADLAAGADVVVHNFRPATAGRLGVDDATLRPGNPGLVHLAISGFGLDGRDADLKAYEGIVAARTGQFVIQNGYRDDGPIYDAIFKCSFGASMLGLIGVLSALHVRDLTGFGQAVHTSLTQANFVYSYDGIRPEDPTILRRLTQTQGRDPHNEMPGYRIARCADGKWIQSGSAMGSIFENLMRALGIDQYFTDPRFANGPRGLPEDALQDLLGWIDAAYATRPLADWMRILEEHDAAFAPFLTTQEFMDYPQVRHNGHVVEVEDATVGPMEQIGPLVRFVGSTWEWPGFAPRPGEDGLPTDWTPREAPEGTTPPDRLPLEDVTILDLATFAAAPGGPGLLADLGARVIKVEVPHGDLMGAGPYWGGELFFRVNRGKERLAVDLKDPRGREVVHRLVADADVVLHNFRPGVPERLGIDYETLRELNDRLVYVYGASFGSTGPDSKRPAFDAVMSALAGGEVLQAGEGNPPQQRQTTDHSGLLGVAVAILLGLRERDRTGRSQQLETTMLAGAAYLFSDDFLRYDGKPPRPIPDHGQYGLSALYRLYRTAGQGWVFLAAPQPDEFGDLRTVLDDRRLDDDRFTTPEGRREHDEALAEVLADVFASRSADDWERDLRVADVACVVADRTWPTYLFDEADTSLPDFTTEFDIEGIGHLVQTGLAVNLFGTPGRVGQVEPVGGSTDRLLRDQGRSDEEITELREAGVLGPPAS